MVRPWSILRSPLDSPQIVEILNGNQFAVGLHMGPRVPITINILNAYVAKKIV